jgi:hypothetical protein
MTKLTEIYFSQDWSQGSPRFKCLMISVPGKGPLPDVEMVAFWVIFTWWREGASSHRSLLRRTKSHHKGSTLMIQLPLKSLFSKYHRTGIRVLTNYLWEDTNLWFTAISQH